MAPNGTKSVLITGCSTRGIGHALALTFHHQGFTVFATARNITKMSDLTSLPHTHFLALDVTSKSNIQQAVEFVAGHTNGRGLDILINNSGQQYIRPMMDMVEEEARKMLDINFWGVFTVTQAFVDMVILAKGTIVNVASISGYWYTPYMTVYNASKAALAIFGETLRLELQPFGVRAISIITGAVDTNIMKTPLCQNLAVGNDNDGVKHMSAEEFAEKVPGDVIGGANGKIWRAGYSSIVRVINALMPTGVLDGILSKDRGLDAL